MEVMENASLRTAEVFKALGHPARLEIVKSLFAGERCVCELVGIAGLGWSSVSRHLAVLKAAGVLADEKRGMQVFYRLCLPCVAGFIQCLEGGAPEAFTGCIGHDEPSCDCLDLPVPPAVDESLAD
jgi:ArsR family transcriptional regulator